MTTASELLRARPRMATSTWVLLAGAALLATLSFATLRLEWGALLAPGAAAKIGAFVGEFFPPDLSPALLGRVGGAMLETLAMSLLGTVLAAAAGSVLAVPASHRTARGRVTVRRELARLVLNALRSIPELVWAGLAVIAMGLGPCAGTLALAAHTTGVLGYLYAESLENQPPEPARALRDNGAGAIAALLYALLPQALPQFLGYSLYRWENNIRAAAVLGVVGAGGLGQLLYYHLSLFQLRQAATVLGAMLVLVAVVDGTSYWARHRLVR